MVASEYQQTLDYLYTVLPMFQRVGAVAYKRDLSNTIALCQALGNPHQKLKTIHVGGTNGKGSSSHMIAAILQQQGYKTGLYTSPHLKEFTERIRVDGQQVSEDFVVSFVERIRPEIERIKPSFFEITVAMAFDYFVSQQVDYAVIEVGLGGRLDSTNVITPLVSLITNIGFDHKDLLGDTLEAIAGEKAGIIKNNVGVVISERQKEIEHVFINKARVEDAPIVFAEDHYKVRQLTSSGQQFEVFKDDALLFDDLRSELTGGYQRKNIAGVLTVIDELRKLGILVDDRAICEGIAATISLTGLKGRWQKLHDRPLTYCDTGHNAEGVKEVITMIDTLAFTHLHFVIGVVKDKDPAAVLSLLPKDATYYFCQAAIPRAMPVEELQKNALAFELNGDTYKTVANAIAAARKAAKPDDLIFIGGSTFVVAEIEEL
ncbi:MAG: folylpolyglutamate synthase/dihydrofolate synthase family protein [Cyclobacteriaceae bacterium]